MSADESKKMESAAVGPEVGFEVDGGTRVWDTSLR